MEVAPLEAAAEWLERYRANWAENFARLDAVLEAMKSDARRAQQEDRDETA